MINEGKIGINQEKGGRTCTDVHAEQDWWSVGVFIVGQLKVIERGCIRSLRMPYAQNAAAQIIMGVILAKGVPTKGVSRVTVLAGVARTKPR